ncbi:type IV secretion system DNA-binding domain-containing protein [Pirellulales bacterium]|nr:type IV secretion system DNA-binding domain-containing protein [Pirellulales bacterium]
MDPTKQPVQAPVKAIVDRTVFVIATYVVPAAAAVLMFAALLVNGAAPLQSALVSGCYFWAVVHKSLMAYRKHLVVPRAFDISLDPPAELYLRVARDQAIAPLLLPLPLFVLPAAAPASALATVLVAALWFNAVGQTLAQGERAGTPLIQDGAMGQRLKPLGLLRQALAAQRRRLRFPFRLGGVELDLGEFLKNVLLLGAVGSGKTLAFKQIMLTVVPLVPRFKNWRALVVDPKGEFYPVLSAVLPRHQIKVVNPGEPMSSVWRARDDLKSPQHIHEACHSLIPREQNETQPFFSDGARDFTFGASLVFSRCAPDAWRFSDLFWVLISPRRLETILRIDPETQAIFQTYARNERVFCDVYATLRSKIADFLPVVAEWSHLEEEAPHRTVSMTEWAQGNFVLLVGKRPTAGVAHDRILSVLLKRTTQLLLEGPTGQSIKDPHSARMSFVLIEEAARAGKLPLMDLVTNGRDHGVGILVASQSIPALYEVYGEQHFDALASEFHSTGFLASNCPKTAKWMSERLGKILASRKDQGQQRRDPQQLWNYAVDPTLFMTLRQGKAIGPGCVPGVFTNSQIGAWYSEEGVDLPPRPPASPPPPLPTRPFRPWDENDLKRLNLLHLKDQLLGGDDFRGSPSPPSSAPHRPKLTNYPRFRP